MRSLFLLRRRAFGRLLLLLVTAAFLPWKGRNKPSSRRKGPPRIPEKPFREEDLWSPHHYAG